MLAQLLSAVPTAQPALAQVAPVGTARPVTPPTIRVPDSLVNAPITQESVPSQETQGAPSRPFDPAAYRAAARRANTAMAAQDWAAASKDLEEVLALKPDSKEAAYNLGVARFQQGDFAGARTMFQQSAQNASADLAARSMYNEGNSIYADAVRNLPPLEAKGAAASPGSQPQAAGASPEAVQKAVKQVEQAFTHFKDAAAANPSDEDSAANAETALKLLKELRKIQQQQQQQQQSSEDKKQQDQQQQQKDSQSSQDKQNENQQQQQQSQDSQQDESKQSQSDSQQPSANPQQQQQKKQQSQSNQQNQNDQQSQPGDQAQDQQQRQQESQKQSSEPKQNDQPKKPEDSKQSAKDKQNQDPKPQDSGNQQQQQQQQQQQPNSQDPSQQDGQGSQAAQPSKDTMDRSQADRLLQLVRDKEKSRNAERKAEQARTRQTPVDKDW